MKRTTYIVVVTFLILSVLLSGCGAKPEDFVTDLQCTQSDGDCTILVTSNYHDNMDYHVEVAVEAQGTPIGETVLYPNTQAVRHSSWYRLFHSVFNHKDTLASDETESYIVDNVQGNGQTLVRTTIKITKGFLAEPITLVNYSLINFPFESVETPIVNSLQCSDGRILARTDLEEGASDQTMAIYLNGELETAYTTFTVEDGSYAQINIPLPEGTTFIELDVLGHRSPNPYSTNKSLEQAHKFRAYCIPTP